jgi:chromosome condensin MukBEF MukE localization factor
LQHLELVAGLFAHAFFCYLQFSVRSKAIEKHGLLSTDVLFVLLLCCAESGKLLAVVFLYSSKYTSPKKDVAISGFGFF